MVFPLHYLQPLFQHVEIWQEVKNIEVPMENSQAAGDMSPAAWHKMKKKLLVGFLGIRNWVK